MILFQNGESLPRGNGDIALGSFQSSIQDFQKSGFTGTVCTDQSIAVAFREFDVYILE